jgi:DNA-binding PadR family transcriptional regulator
MAKRRRVGNLLALAILAVLAPPGQSMYPYQMATALRRTGKDRDMRIKWGSFYTVVKNLERHGLIEATGSDREGRRPERTLYALTSAGRAEFEDWLRELVAVPEPEQSRFEAALSVLGPLSPDEVTVLLEQRLRALDEDIAAQQAMLDRAGKDVARIFLIETEYALAMRRTEAAWVRSLHAEIANGTLPGLAEWRTYYDTGRIPQDMAAQWTQALAEGRPSTD